MVKTSRIVWDIRKGISKLAPILIGFLILMVFAFTLQSFIRSKQIEEYEILNASRNELVKLYNSGSSNFNSLREDSLVISIRNTDTVPSDYLQTLEEFSNLNRELEKLSLSILEISTQLSEIGSFSLDDDLSRVKGHELSSEFIDSLESYYILIVEYSNVLGCFNSINLTAKDASIRNEITTCTNSSEPIMGKYLERIPGTNEYWTVYKKYWQIIYKAHNSPKQSDADTIQKELQSTYNILKERESDFYDSAEKLYISEYLSRFQEMLLSE